jgi:hypothetical protein
MYKISCFTFRWFALIYFGALSVTGCADLPPTQPVETQTADMTSTPLLPTDTRIPETDTPTLELSPTQLVETQPAKTHVPTLDPTQTQSIETETPDVPLTSTSAVETQTPEPEIRIPAQSDWVDYGTIFEAGSPGEWDLFLRGGFAFSVLKKDGVYYLYYQGSSDYQTEIDETVLWRAIGVATSLDGIHFSKYEGNPILTWFPNQFGEEGAVSSGVTVGAQGETILFYGANTQAGPTTVNADSRVASSLDGFNFTDLGIVLNRRDPSVWGSGDELFAVDAIYESGQWIVYYIPNGVVESGLLGVAYGNAYDALNQSSAVTSSGEPISVWGTAGHVKLDQDTYLLILNNIRERRTEVRQVSWQTPNLISEPVAVYQFDEVEQALLLLDRENDIWFMYYSTPEDSYGVKLAPAGDNPLPTPITP